MKLAPARHRYRDRQELLLHQAKKSLGQNFLVSDLVIEKILKAADSFDSKDFIEIGPGLGALTDGLLKLANKLILVELDSGLAAYWRTQGCEVNEVDALQWHWDLTDYSSAPVLISNLPYQISSSLVIERSLDTKPLHGMVLMFQKEVAQRLKASSGQSAFGFLSVIAQTFWNIELLLEASSHDFSPPPKVASRVLVFRPRETPIDDRRRYLRLIKACFSQPRKFMSSNLAAEYGIPKEEMKQKFVSWNLNPQIRAEQLRLEDFLRLYKVF